MTRDPRAAVHTMGVAALGTETLVLLLAVAPLSKLGGPGAGVAIGLVLVLAVLAVVLAGLLRRGWIWWAAVVVPVGLLAGGALHWSLAVLGVFVGLLWGYVLYVRRAVLLGASSGSGSGARSDNDGDGDGDGDATSGRSSG